MKVKAIAPANLAFIKYWGNANAQLRIPNNGSVSMNLDGVTTETEIEFLPNLIQDEVMIDGEAVTGAALTRVTKFLDQVRKLGKTKAFARVKSQNSFPKGTGIASSASAFAALALAASKAVGLDLTEPELSQLARLGSGSASRSIPTGFVEWLPGTSHETSYAVSLYPPDYWDICDLVCIVSKEHKKVGSSQGHQLAETSPFYRRRVKDMPSKITALKQALKEKDFTVFGQIAEAETLNMHAVMMTSEPSLLYWAPGTMEVLQHVVTWREEDGLESYFSLDAGPNVHVLCLQRDAAQLMDRLQQLPLVEQVLLAKPAGGARFVQ